MEPVQVFKALADETRLRILNLVAHRELCVCQLVDVLGLGQSKVSRHLAHLRNARLVVDRREGLWMYYSLAEPNSPWHAQVVQLILRAGEQLPAAVQDVRALSELGDCGRLCPDHGGKRESSMAGAAS